MHHLLLLVATTGRPLRKGHYWPSPSFPEAIPSPEESPQCASTLREDEAVELQIFVAPAFRGDSDEDARQEWAVDSWVRACRGARARVVVLAAEPAAAEFAARKGLRHVCIGKTMLGPPRFDEIVAVLAAQRGVVVFVNADVGVDGSIVGLARLNATLAPVRTEWGKFERAPGMPHGDWIAVARRRNFSSGARHVGGGYDLWAWNNPNRPLLPFEIPPLRVGRPNFDNWFLSMAISTGQRHVIDATEAIVILHKDHGRHFGDGAAAKKGNIFSYYRSGNADAYVNMHLAYRWYEASGKRYSYAVAHGTTCEAPYVLDAAWSLSTRAARLNYGCTPGCPIAHFRLACPRDGVGPLSGSFFRSMVKGYADETERLRLATHYLPGIRSPNMPLKSVYFEPAQTRWPYTVDSVLSLRATPRGAVVLVVANSAAQEYVANFHCNMQRIGLDHDVVAALDDALYEWGVLQGMPVFHAAVLQAPSTDYAEFHDHSFRSLTKLKSLVVLAVLKKGYSVLLSDVDVVWIRNPLSFFAGKTSIFIQSNAAMVLPAHTPTRIVFNFSGRVAIADHLDDQIHYNSLNSGLYYVPSTPAAVAAFEHITADAHADVGATEQPSFHRVLCCSQRGSRVGDDACRYIADSGDVIDVVLLPRLQFPTGGVFSAAGRLVDLANEANALSLSPPLFALHFNYIQGTDAKLCFLLNFWFLATQPRRFGGLGDGAICRFPSVSAARLDAPPACAAFLRTWKRESRRKGQAPWRPPTSCHPRNVSARVDRTTSL